jgi:hypothetical protein
MISQDVNLNKNELKKLSRDFRIVAGRLLRTSQQEGISNLKRLIQFIENSLILNDFVQSNHVVQYSEDDFFKSSGRYNLPEKSNEEISFIYQLLRYGSENFSRYDDFPLRINGYRGSSRNIQSWVDNFNKEVVNPFVNYFEAHIQSLIIDMGDSDQKLVHIQVHGNVHGNIMNQPQESIIQNNKFENSILGGGVSARDYTGKVTNNYSQPQTLSEAAAEIQKLLKQLEQTYPIRTFAEKAVVADEALRKIESNSDLKSKITSALTAVGKEALKEAVDHPVMNILMAGIEGWQTPTH